MPFFFFPSNEEKSINYFADFDIKSFQEHYSMVLGFLRDMTSLSQKILKPGVLVQCSTCHKETNIKSIKKDVSFYVSDHVQCKRDIDQLKTKQRSLEESLKRANGQTAEGSDVDYTNISQKLKDEKQEQNALNTRKDSENLSGEIKQLKECNDDLTKKLEETEKRSETLRNDIERFQFEIDAERLNMAMTQSKLSSDLEEKSREVGTLSETNRALASERTELKYGLEKSIKEKDHWKTQYKLKVAALDSENKELNSKVVNLENELRSTTEKEDYLTGELRTLQNIIDEERSDSHNTIDFLENKIKELERTVIEFEEKRKKVLIVNVHTSLKDSLSQPAQNHIEKCLREKLDTEKIGLEVRRYASPDVTPGPVLVLCMNVSRLGTDVKEAMKGTPGNQDVIVVVLHHKEIHALPSQSSDRVLTGDEYKQLGAIVDAAFWSGKGMYPCTLNTRAIDKIFDFLLRFAN